MASVLGYKVLYNPETIRTRVYSRVTEEIDEKNTKVLIGVSDDRSFINPIELSLMQRIFLKDLKIIGDAFFKTEFKDLAGLYKYDYSPADIGLKMFCNMESTTEIVDL